MRVGLGQFMEPTERRLRFVKQLGVDDVLLNMYQYDAEYEHMPDGESMPLEGEEKWSYENLRSLRERIETAGLRLNAIENVPISFYDDAMLGSEGREEQIENMKGTIWNRGRASPSPATTGRRPASGAPRRRPSAAAPARPRSTSARSTTSARTTMTTLKRNSGRTTSTSSTSCCQSPRRRG